MPRNVASSSRGRKGAGFRPNSMGLLRAEKTGIEQTPLAQAKAAAFRQLPIFDIGRRQRTLAAVEPFDAEVARRIGAGRPRGARALWGRPGADDGEMGRLA